VIWSQFLLVVLLGWLVVALVVGAIVGHGIGLAFPDHA
jgi:hypothetical protein